MKLHSIGESIKAYDHLVAGLRTGIQLELGVLPPYFTAMYSLKDQASPACRTMRDVMMEEMLHLAINCNLLNAIGAQPLIEPPYLPSYPMPLAHYDTTDKKFTVPLQALSAAAAKHIFMTIERPSWTLHPSHEEAPAQTEGWHTLGQFYKGIIHGFEAVAKIKPDLFVHDSQKQYGPNSIYSNGGGVLKPITNLQEAVAAITENMDQTQGYKGKEFQPYGPDGAHEPSHYRRFEQLANGEVQIGETYPMIPDIKPEGLPEPVRSLSVLFNDCWGIFTRALDETFNNPLDYGVYFTQTMWMMKKVFPQLAVLLMSTPVDKRGNAGPSFDYSDKGIEQVLTEAKKLQTASKDPEWKDAVGGTVEVLEYMIRERNRLEQQGI